MWINSDDEYYTADEGGHLYGSALQINDINQQLSPVYPNYICGAKAPSIYNWLHFIWSENVSKSNCANLYHEYLTWCKTNNKKPLHNIILGKNLFVSQSDLRRPEIGIMVGKREWQYVLNRSIIMNKIYKLFDSIEKHR